MKAMFEPGKYVYHYTRSAVAIEKILPNLTLRMGPLKNVNDPRESKVWPFRFYTRAPETNTEFRSEYFHAASEPMTDYTFVLCCTRDDSDVLTAPDERHLRSGYGHSRMWSQYADNHQGMCLVLDLERLDASIRGTCRERPLYSGPVDYYSSGVGPVTESHSGPYDLVYLEDMISEGPAALIQQHLSRFYRQLLFSKHSDWRDENEYRWVIWNESREDIFVPIADSLQAVILGHDCDDITQNRAIALSRQHEFAVYRLRWLGWSVSLLGDLADPNQDPTKRFSGTFSFSTEIPCAGVFVPTTDHTGATRTVHIQTDGAVRILDT